MSGSAFSCDGALSNTVTGGRVSTVHERCAGEASVPPAVVARTDHVCAPSPRPLNAAGEVHAAHAPASSRHSNVAPASGELKAKVAEDDPVRPLGPPSITVSGGVVGGGGAGTVQVAAAGERSWLPAASIARASSRCDPGARDD